MLLLLLIQNHFSWDLFLGNTSFHFFRKWIFSLVDSEVDFDFEIILCRRWHWSLQERLASKILEWSVSFFVINIFHLFARKMCIYKCDNFATILVLVIFVNVIFKFAELTKLIKQHTTFFLFWWEKCVFINVTILQPSQFC